MRAGARHFAYAALTDEEFATVKAVAKKDGLSMANFVRRCVNAYLFELGDDVPLVAEIHRRERPAKESPVRGPGRPRNTDRWK